jgi:hypothetical protein
MFGGVASSVEEKGDYPVLKRGGRTSNIASVTGCSTELCKFFLPLLTTGRERAETLVPFRKPTRDADYLAT